ncbi:hypothetical protein MWU59_05780 [Flavobacteriaceae bacterium F08102]|nr:hypothetical protein [Flavobacteriaceae bacterium F08102]
MKKITKFILLITLLLLTSLHAQEPKKITTDIYTVTYDDFWTAEQNGERGMSFILKAPLENASDKFQENINLIIQDLSGYDLDLAGYTAISLDQINTMFKSSELISSRTRKKETGKYQEVMFTAPNGAYNLKFLQHYYILKKKAFIITFTAEEKNFDLYFKSATNTLNSFVLK